MKITRKRAQRRAERAVLKGEPKQKEGKAAVQDRRTSSYVWVMRGPRWDSERGSGAETRCKHQARVWWVPASGPEEG